MKKIALFLMVFACITSASAKNEINIKKLGENSASFVVSADQKRTVLVLFPASEMLPKIDASIKGNIQSENVDIADLKPFRNNAYVVFDGMQNMIPITIKGLKPNSSYYLALIKPENSEFKPIELEFTTVAPEPKKQARAIAFRQPTENAIELVWTNGDGENRIVVATKGNLDVAPPVDGTEYIATAKYGDAKSKIGHSSFVVYSGNKSECKVENLEPATLYNFQIFEFNGKGKSINYITEANSGNPRKKITAIPAPKMLDPIEVHEIGFIARWESKGNIEKFILDIAYDEAFTDFADTYENADIGDIQEIEVIDLDPKKSWYVRVKAMGDGTFSRYSNVVKVK